MATYFGVFASQLVMNFAIFLLLSGLFTAYFGAGRSRKIGLGLTLGGLLVLFIFASATWKVGVMSEFGTWDATLVATGVVAVVGAAIGGFVALTLFLVSIMRA